MKTLNGRGPRECASKRKEGKLMNESNVVNTPLEQSENSWDRPKTVIKVKGVLAGSLFYRLACVGDIPLNCQFEYRLNAVPLLPPTILRFSRLLLLTLVAFAAHSFAASPPVGYVTFNGLDTNPCSRSAPCQTIAHAVAVVGAGGVVDIVGSGTYEPFTITQAVSVEADPGIVATIKVPPQSTGITINAGPSDVVTLKRLSVWGSAVNEVGIRADSAAEIVVEDCVSRNVRYGAVLSSTTAAFKVIGGVFAGSDTSLFIRADTNNVSIDSVKIYGTSSNAAVDAIGNDITITRSILAGSGTSGFNPGVWVKGGFTVVLENDVISGYGPGVQVSGGTGPGGAVYLSNNTITNNSTGVIVGSGIAYTRSNNTITANTTNVSGSLTKIPAE